MASAVPGLPGAGFAEMTAEIRQAVTYGPPFPAGGRSTEKPVYDILPGWPEAGLDDDAQFNPDGSGHQPDQGMLQVGGEILASWLAEDHGYAR